MSRTAGAMVRVAQPTQGANVSFAVIGSKERLQQLRTGLPLFVRALWLCRLAQAAGGRQPLPALIPSLCNRRWLPSGVAPDAAYQAALRAGRRGSAWLGLRDTCLVRALVVGALLSDQPEVRLHVGFGGRGGDRALEGHAWVSVAGTVAGGPGAAMSGDGAVTELTIPLRRDGGSADHSPGARPGSIPPHEAAVSGDGRGRLHRLAPRRGPAGPR